MRLENKVAIITGGAGGIGRAIAESFLKEGAIVFVVDYDKLKGEKFIKDVAPKYERESYFMPVDVSRDEEVKEVVRRVYDKFSRIDVLVNCAGIYEDCLFLEMDEKQWDKTIKINLYGCFFCTKAVAGYMKGQRHGSIVNISSIGGQMAPSDGHAHYAASKAGMIGLTRAVAKELAPLGIRMNNICPGVTEGTDIGERAIVNVGKAHLNKIPLGRMALPADIAQAAVYLASDESSYVTGAILSVNGGLLMD
jgi:3-oxoacyl-[acyl-carrier protein] reductase